MIQRVSSDAASPRDAGQDAYIQKLTQGSDVVRHCGVNARRDVVPRHGVEETAVVAVEVHGDAQRTCVCVSVVAPGGGAHLTNG